MDTPARLLRLLVVLSSRPSWRADELAARFEVTTRTLRRDVNRLRDLGYPVESTPGRHGGYSMGSGGRLPPLLLDDDEAVAVSVALRELSRTGDPTLSDAAVSAMTKLAQVLPSALRDRVAGLGEVAVSLGRPRHWSEREPVDARVLMDLASACRRGDRLRFDYTTADDRASRRTIDPHRLVTLQGRWYLVAWDLDRADWRTFRIDRIGPPAATGHRVVERDVPDALALVVEGIAVRAYDIQAVVRMHASPAVVRRDVGPTEAVVETTDPDATTTMVRVGGELDWLARFLSSLPFRCEVIEPASVRKAVRAHARALLADHRG
jgi:predicted DNA-binding transcriptional regulator YafY